MSKTAVSDSIAPKDETKNTYPNPIPNIQLSATFLFIAICRPHSIGMGRITTMKSCSRLTLETNKPIDLISPQEIFPTSGLFLGLGGRQRRLLAITALARNTQLKTKTQKLVIRKERVGKMWMKRTMIEVRIIVTAKIHKSIETNGI